MDNKELLLTTCENAQQWTACVWDYTSLNALHHYKSGGGGAATPKTLQLLGADYVIAADCTKPLLHVWPLNSQEPLKRNKIILPDRASCVAVCPRTTYLAAGIAAKLYVWHLTSGRLMTVQRRNYQPIKCVRFSSDGTLLAVGGEDGLLIVYEVVALVTFTSGSVLGAVEPLYTRTDHSLAIVDLFLGGFGRKSRAATVSLDQTAKLYDLATGQLLLNLIFDEPLSAVVFDTNCWNLFVGDECGLIRQHFLKEPPRQLDYHHQQDHTAAEKNRHRTVNFIGHSKRIVCLELNLTSTILISGSLDCHVYTWNIQLQHVLQKIEHKAPITNIKCVWNYAGFFQKQHQQQQKVFFNNGLDKELKSFEEDFIDYRLQTEDVQLSDEEDEGDDACQGGKKDLEVIRELQRENDRLKCCNKQIYDAALQVTRKYCVTNNN